MALDDKYRPERVEYRVKRKRRYLEQTTDLWLCQCLLCGTANPIQPTFRPHTVSDVIAVIPSKTILPTTCAGCGKPLEVWRYSDLEGVGSVGDRIEKTLQKNQRKCDERRARGPRKR